MPVSHQPIYFSDIYNIKGFTPQPQPHKIQFIQILLSQQALFPFSFPTKLALLGLKLAMQFHEEAVTRSFSNHHDMLIQPEQHCQQQYPRCDAGEPVQKGNTCRLHQVWLLIEDKLHRRRAC
jgi:hypothetical protein